MRKTIFIILLITCYNTYSQSNITSIKPDMVFVQGGVVDIGTEDKPEKVSVKKFWIGKYEVTGNQYKTFCIATNRKIPNSLKTVKNYYLPIRNISYNDAIAYCNWLTDEFGGNWRLPTHEEWLFAAKGGVKSRGYQYSGGNNINEVAIYNQNGVRNNINYLGINRVGAKKGNELGLHDMTGNVWEWCQGETNSYKKIVRGGSVTTSASDCKVDQCFSFLATDGASEEVGFRVLLEE